MPDPTPQNNSPPIAAAATTFAERLERAATTVFGDGELSARLQDVARRLIDDCRRLAERGSDAVPTLAVVGRLGEGKSWLSRCFLDDRRDNDAIRARLHPGQDAEHRTNRLLWFGPNRPVGLRVEEEDFQLVPAAGMLDLGRPYVVGDAPGTSFDENAASGPTSIALSSAPLKLLVLSTQGLRDGGLTRLVAAMDGATILPIVRFRPEGAADEEPLDEARADVERQMTAWRRAATHATLLDPLYMPESNGRGAGGEDVMRRRLQDTLRPRLAEVRELRHAVESQIRGRIATAKAEAADLLADFRKRVGAFASPLDEVGRTLPDEVIGELAGDETALRVGIRQRLRAEWLDAVPAICFPYRTLVGLLSLTAGAWDRLILAGLGGLPSLVLTGLQSVRNMQEAREFAERLRARTAERIERALADRLRDSLGQMRRAAAASADDATAPRAAIAAPHDLPLKVVGLDGIETEMQGVLRSCIARQTPARAWAALVGILGTAVFWGLFAGPIVSLYGGYFLAWFAAIDNPATALAAFPRPSASMLLTGLVLSAAPAFLIALVGLSWASRGRRVRNTLIDFRDEIDKLVRRRHTAGELRVEPTDPQLGAVQFLLELR